MIDFITNNILRNTPVLLGIIAAIGLILQKKRVEEVIRGGLLAALGMVILQQGTSVLIGAIAPINIAFQSISGVVSEGLNDITFTSNYGGYIGLVMFFGLAIHLMIARFTPIKTIFLTGHILWWLPFIFIAAGVEVGLTGWFLIAFSAMASALYWSIVPWVLRKYVRDVTNDDSFTLGHPACILALISGFVASKVGNKEKSCEDINMPKGLEFFKEISISGGVVIFIMFIVVGLCIPTAFSDAKEGIFGYAVKQGLMFGAGLIILMEGVKMLINQIVPAFKGISEKVVPDAMPALDCAVLFNYKPNAVLIGFVTAMITSTIIILIANTFNVFNVLLIPLVTTSFFECGTAAVIGEGQGGLRGAIIGTIVAACVMIGLVGVSAIAFSQTIQNWMLVFGGNDFSLFGIIAKVIASLFA